MLVPEICCDFSNERQIIQPCDETIFHPALDVVGLALILGGAILRSMINFFASLAGWLREAPILVAAAKRLCKDPSLRTIW